MCGIAGIINFNSPEDKEPLLRQMVSILHHRGPDAAGIYTDAVAGLGHARLSIIDLSGGDQPIHNEDKTIWIVFNGEIFNYPELRKDLVNKGHRFYTQSDTEVLVHLYEDKGCDMFQELNGQFALGIWDKQKNKLILARDRVGIRPLFFHESSGRLVFGSEVKSIFADLNIQRVINPDILSEIFTAWTPLGSETVFKGIHQLQPGHFAEYSNDGLIVRPYWSPNFNTSKDNEYIIDESVDELNGLLLDAAKIRLRADVPVGAYLSGGIDSTFTTSLVKTNFNNQLETFSVGFTDGSFDESRYQVKAVDALGTYHRTVTCSEKDIGASFPDVVWHMETPVFRTAPTPLYHLSGLVRKSDFKVVLTGEGADELFAGYNIFKEDRVRRFWAKNPESTMRPILLKKLYPYIFDKNKERSNIYVYNFFKQKLTDIEHPVYSHLIRWQNTSQIQNFFVDDYRKEMPSLDDVVERYRFSMPDGFESWEPLARAQYIEMDLFLSNYLLSSQGDRMAMANSVEGRYPFLDHRVIEFACRLPAKFKLNGLTEKYILKKAAEGKIPREIIHRPKQPYRAPISKCFFGDEPLDYVEEMLSAEKIRDYGYFDSGKVARLVKKCKQKQGQLLSERENMALVGILSTQLVHHQFIENFPGFPVVERDDIKYYN